MTKKTPYLYGIHDSGGADLLLEDGMTGWIVVTEEIGHDPNVYHGADYRYLSDRGLTVIARLNNGYGGNGTIPIPEHYDDFAQRFANFVANTAGCDMFIVGNEPNHRQEWPGGEKIEPAKYAECFRACYAQAKALRPKAEILIAPMAPWNVQSGIDWIQYATIVYAGIQKYDGVAIHAYSRGSDPNSILSDDRMDPPYQMYHNGFQTYKDWLELILPGVPIYWTEANQDSPWDPDAITIDWVDVCYAEIDRHNAENPFQQIRAVVFYSWENRQDGHGFRDIQSVHNGLRHAKMFEYVWNEEPPLEEKARLLEINDAIRSLLSESDDIVRDL